MCLERSNRGIKRKFIYNIFILLVGIIGGIVLCSKLKIFHLSEMENREKIESEDWENYINCKNVEKMDNDIEAESNIQGEEGLREILVNIHKDYICKQWFGEEKYDYNISITVAIVGEETSYWWEFHAKEGLGENGEIILESNGGDSYSGPGNYDQQNGAYASDIDSIIQANRLVIPLLVTENDKVEKIEIRRDERNINLDHNYLK